jgi:hypothetical protein
MYDAWAAYDEHAVGTQLRGVLRRPADERTQANKERAISYAAYRTLADVLPVNTESVYKPLMKQLGYDPEDRGPFHRHRNPHGNRQRGLRGGAGVPASRQSEPVGDMAPMSEKEASVLLSGMRSDEGGERPASECRPYKNEPRNEYAGVNVAVIGPYGDWSGYRPVNSPGTVPARFPFSKPLNPDHWQPLTYTDSTGSLVLQMFADAQWCFVTPFALAKGDEFRPAVEPGPAHFGSPEYQQQAEELVALSAGLTDQQKMISEYWSDGPNTEQPPGHWLQFAQYVSARDHHSLDDDVKMFFALSNAMLEGCDVEVGNIHGGCAGGWHVSALRPDSLCARRHGGTQTRRDGCRPCVGKSAKLL